MPASPNESRFVPHSDVLRVDASRPAAQPSAANTPTAVALADGGTAPPPAGCVLPGYPFTKDALRNDGLGYGEFLSEQYACYVNGKLVKAVSKARSLRTRTARTFPDIASPIDLGVLPRTSVFPERDPSAAGVGTIEQLRTVSSVSAKDGER